MLKSVNFGGDKYDAADLETTVIDLTKIIKILY